MTLGPEETAPTERSASSDEATLLETGPDGGPQRLPVNMYETTEALVIVTPMPGVMADDVEIVIEADRLTMKAQLRTPAPKHYLMHEWDYGDYERCVPIPTLFRGKVRASLGNGQLAISIARDGDRDSGSREVVHPVMSTAGQAR
jgi:HSP20 family molecular chaperone IbpA